MVESSSPARSRSKGRDASEAQRDLTKRLTQSVSIGAPQAVPKQIDVSLREPLKYRLSASLSPDPDEDTMWLDIDAVLQRPLHVSGIPSAKIDRLRLEGPAGEIEPLSTQAFVATASGGKVRVKNTAPRGGIAH